MPPDVIPFSAEWSPYPVGRIARDAYYCPAIEEAMRRAREDIRSRTCIRLDGYGQPCGWP